MILTKEEEAQLTEKLQRSLAPCAHCGSAGILERKGNSIRYWLVRCSVCRASVKGTEAQEAADGWNRRPTNHLVKLPVAGYLLPGGQKWSYVAIHEDNTVSFIDWMDGEIVGQIDINLGHFYLSKWERDAAEHV